MMTRQVRGSVRGEIYVVAPSSVLDLAALDAGCALIEQWTGALLERDPACGKRDLFFAGSDEARSEGLERAFWESPAQQVVAARGGYGAGHLLPFLERIERRRGPPRLKKTFWGCSDSTALMQWVRDRWNWRVVHSPMPGLRFDSLSSREAREWKKLYRSLTRGDPVQQEFGLKRVAGGSVDPRRGFKDVVNRRVEASGLQGGNLSVLCSLLGTPYEPASWKNQVVFLEDVSETWSRVDRMVEHLTQWALARRQRPAALVLGNFLACKDAAPVTSDGKPLRSLVSDRVALTRIFGRMGERLKCPVFSGLPVGHGPGRVPLMLAQGRRGAVTLAETSLGRGRGRSPWALRLQLGAS